MELKSTMKGEPLPLCPNCLRDGETKLRRLRSGRDWTPHNPKNCFDGLLTVYKCSKGCGEKFVQFGDDEPVVACDWI